jgi:hypothetical protein
MWWSTSHSVLIPVSHILLGFVYQLVQFYLKIVRFDFQYYSPDSPFTIERAKKTVQIKKQECTAVRVFSKCVPYNSAYLISFDV